MTTPRRRYRGTDGIAAEPSASYFAERTPVLVDSNVLIDVLNDHPLWAEWSLAQLEPLVAARRAVIVPIVYAELAPGFATMEALEAALRPYRLVRDALSHPAAFLAGTAYGRYRRSGGTKRSPLPDFYIGAHASLSGCPVLTRDPRRYREYFPKLKVIAPD